MTPTRRFRIFTLIALILGALPFLAACIDSDTTENAVYSDPSAAADLNLPANPRVVALGWSDGEIALSLGVKPVAIYDWMSFGAATKGVSPWISAEFGAENPTLSAASTGDFNYQQIKELDPDLILNVRAKADSKVTDSLKAIAPVVAAPADTADFAVHGAPQPDGTVRLWARRADGALAMDATATLETS